jgi:hypothetical protein
VEPASVVDFGRLVVEWFRAGAKIVGGCCRCVGSTQYVTPDGVSCDSQPCRFATSNVRIDTLDSLILMMVSLSHCFIGKGYWHNFTLQDWARYDP